MTMLEEMTAREYINEALTEAGSLFSKFKVWGTKNKLVAKYKRSKMNLIDVLSKTFNNWSAKNVLTNLDIPIIEFVDTDAKNDGYATDEGIAVDIFCDNPIRTAIHEIAHCVLGLKYDDKDLNEAETEMTCYLVCRYIGFDDDLPYSRKYIQSHLNEQEFSETSIAKCISAANRIIQAGY